MTYVLFWILGGVVALYSALRLFFWWLWNTQKPPKA
jgi:hypothetical protein